MNDLRLQSRKYSAGLTLVEILVALLVISIGLLGVAGLHAYSLRNNHDALVRTHASALAADILDRMRANRTAVYVTDSDYVVGMGETPGGSSEEEESEAEAEAEAEAETEESEDADDEDVSVATNDLIEWKNALAAQLPGGDGSVAIDLATRMVTVTIQWGERLDKYAEEPEEAESEEEEEEEAEEDPGLVTFVTQTEL